MSAARFDRCALAAHTPRAACRRACRQWATLGDLDEPAPVELVRSKEVIAFRDHPGLCGRL
jgi:hypothetical protein